ncbi:MAG TPA: PEP-CTERM sorting domain-containing protein [Phycisphaerae bacterium]|nr:PEP-CTERM sorting domain-containing protein [Phycisphaerae bacterium]HRW55183.1 PEP-CTERM sorting domain-containing protein [Phycisphaerae bacterium]
MMLRKMTALGMFALCAAGFSVSRAHAQVGDPFGSFDIEIRQGGNLIAQDTVTIGPGGDLTDLDPIFVDGTRESHTQIGQVGGSPIILKVVSEGSDSEAFRLTHWYIDVPLTVDLIDLPGVTSLFDPNGGNIDVTITGLEFSNGAAVMPVIVPTPTFSTSFMRDISGNFYESTGANTFNQYGNGLYDIQVGGDKYLDGDLSAYTFDMLASGTSASWRWGNILNPGLLTKVNDGVGATIDPNSPGYVFELGMAMAFVAVPEPTTASLIIVSGAAVLLRRRRKA